MKHLFCILFLIVQFACFSQDQLKNTYNAWHEMHGGVEGSGISRTESYIFVATKTVKVKGIYFNGAEITLNAKDTLQINVFSSRNTGDTANDAENQPDVKKQFNVAKKNNTYYASPAYPYQWPKKLEYIYKKKTYVAGTKKEFDKGGSAYAP
jgi:hypothetical protein